MMRTKATRWVLLQMARDYGEDSLAYLDTLVLLGEGEAIIIPCHFSFSVILHHGCLPLRIDTVRYHRESIVHNATSCLPTRTLAVPLLLAR
ncbi:hypothetical protein AFLA_002673 [Aspergillus flavus NRRL3357]|nr:hypothetical protein AFLA_002673 [Aspergillus flavus NRRL3357]